ESCQNSSLESASHINKNGGRNMKSPDKNISPPKWATRLLQWCCAPPLSEEILGDLQEEFDHQLKLRGRAYARFDYIRNVLGFVRLAATRKRLRTSNQMTTYMLKHYLTVAARNVWRHKTFSIINI